MIRVEVSALKRSAGELNRARGGILYGLALEAAGHLAEGARALSPVDTGKLKASWTVSEAGRLQARAVNPVEYASFVEFGRRNRFGGRFVPGQRFMTRAMEETRARMPKMVKAHLLRAWKGVFR